MKILLVSLLALPLAAAQGDIASQIGQSKLGLFGGRVKPNARAHDETEIIYLTRAPPLPEGCPAFPTRACPSVERDCQMPSARSPPTSPSRCPGARWGRTGSSTSSSASPSTRTSPSPPGSSATTTGPLPLIGASFEMPVALSSPQVRQCTLPSRRRAFRYLTLPCPRYVDDHAVSVRIKSREEGSGDTSMGCAYR